MEWFIFALITSIIWGLCNIIDKIYLSKLKINPYSLTFMMCISSIIYVVLIYIFAQVDFITPWIYFGILLGLLRMFVLLFYSKSVESGELSKVMALVEIHPIVVLAIATAFLGEQLSIFNYLGIFIIVFGGILIILKKLKLWSIDKSAIFAIMCAILYAFEIVFAKLLSGHIDFWSIFFWSNLGLFLFSPIIFIIRKDSFSGFKKFLSMKKRYVFGYFMNDLMGAFAYLLSYAAISLGPASLVSATMATKPLFVLIFATMISLFAPNIIKEELTRRNLLTKLIGILLIIGGSILIL